MVSHNATELRNQQFCYTVSLCKLSWYMLMWIHDTPLSRQVFHMTKSSSSFQTLFEISEMYCNQIYYLHKYPTF
jgi:hypothetical protein